AAPAPLRVHVGGAVAAPGVYDLAEGARVLNAVEAAGGFAEGAARDALNLARTVSDGEQVVVPSEADIAAQEAASAGVGGASAGAGASAPAGSASGKVNINTASATQLDTLPGVGASTAEKIVADREANGPFKTVEDLKRVSGIGDKKFAALADAICVG
ncbi:MAG: helix-hairpin-helix domain-containing protein, partial [Gordonibacter urolithinfaciens]